MGQQCRGESRQRIPTGVAQKTTNSVNSKSTEKKETKPHKQQWQRLVSFVPCGVKKRRAVCESPIKG